MIPIAREAEPEILREKNAEWLTKFVASGNKRPPSKQYAHAQVVTTLHAMSHGKCFYCESKGPLSVDHYIECVSTGATTFRARRGSLPPIGTRAMTATSAWIFSSIRTYLIDVAGRRRHGRAPPHGQAALLVLS